MALTPPIIFFVFVFAFVFVFGGAITADRFYFCLLFLFLFLFSVCTIIVNRSYFCFCFCFRFPIWGQTFWPTPIDFPPDGFVFEASAVFILFFAFTHLNLKGYGYIFLLEWMVGRPVGLPSLVSVCLSVVLGYVSVCLSVSVFGVRVCGLFNTTRLYSLAISRRSVGPFPEKKCFGACLPSTPPPRER